MTMMLMKKMMMKMMPEQKVEGEENTEGKVDDERLFLLPGCALLDIPDKDFLFTFAYNCFK